MDIRNGKTDQGPLGEMGAGSPVLCVGVDLHLLQKQFGHVPAATIVKSCCRCARRTYFPPQLWKKLEGVAFLRKQPTKVFCALCFARWSANLSVEEMKAALFNGIDGIGHTI